ncbi:MAG: hypothetical protein LBG42_07370 [Treponema sp.]|jgi:hypothetical protein|nr:hypothetical protein [Treponema sp.]
MIPLSLQRVKILGVLCTALGTALFAQETSFEALLPGLREQAVILDIIARVVEQNQQEIWQSVNSRVTIPGRPVGIKLVGANIVVAVQFTPYLRRNGRSVLVAQGQIWVDIPNEGVRYKTTIQTIPLEYGEQIYFFPLGPVNSPDDAHIEIQIELRPYQEGESAGTGEGEGNNPEGNDSSQ